MSTSVDRRLICRGWKALEKLLDGKRFYMYCFTTNTSNQRAEATASLDGSMGELDTARAKSPGMKRVDRQTACVLIAAIPQSHFTIHRRPFFSPPVVWIGKWTTWQGVVASCSKRRQSRWWLPRAGLADKHPYRADLAKRATTGRRLI